MAHASLTQDQNGRVGSGDLLDGALAALDRAPARAEGASDVMLIGGGIAGHVDGSSAKSGLRIAHGRANRV
jgi:hypothetical protein